MVRILHLIGSKGSRKFTLGGIKALGALARVSPTALKKQNFLPVRWRRARMRSPAAGFFLANIFLDFSAEEFRRCSLRRSALGERRGEFRCVVFEALNSGKNQTVKI